MSILVVGSVALDSLRTPFGKRESILGGSATYFSLAASFFNKVHIVAVVGCDFPKKYLSLFHSKDIGTQGLHVANGKTFKWKGWYGYDLNTAHTTYTHLNVFRDFDPQIPQDLKKSPYVFLANIDPDLQQRVLNQVQKPRLVACDSMNYWIEHKKASLKNLLKKVAIILLNDSEARQLSGEFNLTKAAKAILSYGPKAVIIKRGENGVVYFSRHTHFIAPAYLLESIFDPTGAGDTFAGAMMGFLSRAKKIDDAAMRKAIIYGSIMASFAVEDFGVERLLEISIGDIRSRYDHFRNVTRF